MKTKIQYNFVLLSPIVFVVVFIVLGLITPNYDPLKRTISRLSIERYGWIQQLNLLQFALGFLVSGFLISQAFKKIESKKFITKASLLCCGFLALSAIFPTNPIEPSQFSFSLLTPSGLVHVVLVILFVLLSPYGVIKLYNIFLSERLFKDLAKLTKFWGLSSFYFSLALMLFIYFNMFPNYRGFLEKLIAVWVIIWLEIVNIWATRILREKTYPTKDV